jgi:hypothetical protein
MPRPPNLFSAQNDLPLREPGPDRFAEALANLAEAKSALLRHDILSTDEHFETLTRVARYCGGFRQVNAALDEIVDNERRHVREGTLSETFMTAVMTRSRLLTGATLAPDEFVTKSVDELEECGQKDQPGRPEGEVKDWIATHLKDIAHAHPKARERISGLLKGLGQNF